MIYGLLFVTLQDISLRKMKLATILLLTTLLLGFFTGCDDSSRSEKMHITITYEIDRKIQWDPATKKLSGTILIKNNAITRGTQLSSNSYGVTFELCPGDRTTIIIKSDEEGTYYNGEFPDLPMQLPQVMNRQSAAELGEYFDYDVRAACELELSAEPISGKYYLILSLYDVQAMWLFGTGFEVPENTPLKDAKFVQLSAGTQEFKRSR